MSEDRSSPFPSKRSVILGLLGFGVFITLLTLAIDAIGLDTLQNAIQSAGPLGPLIYIGIKALTNIIAPLSSGPIQVAAGTLFESVLLGGIYTLIGEVLGGCVNFWIARRLGQPAVQRLLGEQNLERVNRLYDQRLGSWRGLFVLRIVLFSVWDFVSYAAGLAQTVRFSHYFWASLIAGAVPTFAFVWLGNRVLLSPSNLLLLYALLAGGIVLTLVVWQRVFPSENDDV